MSNNQWHHHSNLAWGSAHDTACGIITQKSGERFIVASRGNNNGHMQVADGNIDIEKYRVALNQCFFEMDSGIVSVE